MRYGRITEALCECGCGSLAPLAKYSIPRLGYVKGKPKRFVHNHHPKMENHHNWNGGIKKHSSGYIQRLMPGHPRADTKGYVMEHVLIAEKAIGYVLPITVHVHHANGKKDHNANSNLVICQDSSYHKLLHRRTIAYVECGDASSRRCWICKKYGADVFSNHGRSSLHRSCKQEYERTKRRKAVSNVTS